MEMFFSAHICLRVLKRHDTVNHMLDDGPSWAQRISFLFSGCGIQILLWHTRRFPIPWNCAVSVQCKRQQSSALCWVWWGVDLKMQKSRFSFLPGFQFFSESAGRWTGTCHTLLTDFCHSPRPTHFHLCQVMFNFFKFRLCMDPRNVTQSSNITPCYIKHSCLSLQACLRATNQFYFYWANWSAPPSLSLTGWNAHHSQPGWVRAGEVDYFRNCPRLLTVPIGPHISNEMPASGLADISGMDTGTVP